MACYFKLVAMLSGMIMLTSCTSASSLFDQQAHQSGLQTKQVRSARFKHVIYANKYAYQRLGNARLDTLHVYLGSDGTPWFEGRHVTRDPTPLRPVLLDFVAQDDKPAIYLGRPCYHQLSRDDNCEPEYWTNARYSGVVVDSMAEVLKHYVQQHQVEHVRLIGYSGGGTLAMLIAPQIEEVDRVITLAGNLHPELWAKHHGYLPLTGSLSPYDQPPLPAKIRQIHLYGKRDSNITAAMIIPAAHKQKTATMIALADADHSCCWLAYRQQILGYLR